MPTRWWKAKAGPIKIKDMTDTHLYHVWRCYEENKLPFKRVVDKEAYVKYILREIHRRSLFNL